jgi:hypothetical protein
MPWIQSLKNNLSGEFKEQNHEKNNTDQPRGQAFSYG